MNYKQYYIYLTTNHTNTVIYTGVTNDLVRRITEHKAGKGSMFTSKYKVTKLVYYEVYTDIYEALKREKQIKSGSRKNKIELIEKTNPNFVDLYNEIKK